MKQHMLQGSRTPAQLLSSGSMGQQLPCCAKGPAAAVPHARPLPCPAPRAQMQSTMAMQALQPRVKDLQLRYANEPETLQVRDASRTQFDGSMHLD